eukprot:gene3704-6593_t
MNKRKINNQKTNKFSKKRKEIENFEEILKDLRSKTPTESQEIFPSHDQEEFDPFMGVEEEQEHFEEDFEEFDESDNEDRLEILEGLFELPPLYRTLLKEYRKFQNFYDWQYEVLNDERLADGTNLIYSLPTSGGKTLVAEILMMRNLIVKQKKVLFIVPYVSLVEEKRVQLELFGDELGFQVEPYFGSQGSLPLPKGNILCCATIEKANSIINSLITENQLNELGCVVIDELHMIGETGDRGQILESLLTKLLFYSKKENIQIIGMSATIPNIEDLSNWLNAILYVSTFRPVPLTEYLKIDNEIFDVEGKLLRQLKTPNKKDPDNILQLCEEIVPDGSVLIFCSSKKGCEGTAIQLSNLLSIDLLNINKSEKDELIQNLKTSNQSLSIDETLKKCIPFGVAFHHSGLTIEEKSLIEDAYRKKVLCILAATSTLAAGVNLPAKRVIFRSPYIGTQFLTKSRYLQMSGRAGRAGIDEYGESFLMLTKRNKENEKGMKLVQEELEKTKSQLNKNGIQKLVLDFVSCGINIEDFKEISETTFNFIQTKDVKLVDQFKEEFYFLVEKNFIQKRKVLPNSQLESQLDSQKIDSQLSDHDNSQQLLFDSQPREEIKYEYETTPFGLATFKSSFSMSEAIFVSQELTRCQQQGIILSDELHLCYLLTPIGIQTEPNWNILSNIYNLLSPERHKIAQSIGISNKLLVQKSMSRGRIITNKEDEEKELIAKRFFYSLILYDLVNEKGLWEVEQKYQVNRGVLQSLMQSSGMFAGMMLKFCERMNWNLLQSILSQYSKRLEFGVKSDALELIEIDGVGPIRARLLLNYGFKDPMILAKSKPSKIVSKLGSKLGPNPKRTAEKIIDNHQ